LIETLYSQNNQLLAGQASLREERDSDRAAIAAQLHGMQRNIRRYTNQPFRRLADPPRAPQNQPPPLNEDIDIHPAEDNHHAELMPAPRDLYILWDEYNVGVGGRKAARLFTGPERGRVKHKFCRRKVVWSTVSLLINAGLTREAACERLYDVYGYDSTVTRIIERLKVDKRNGTVDPRLLA
jgi:hypothetical protein